METRDRAKLMQNSDAIKAELEVDHVLLYLSGTVLTPFECDKIHGGRTRVEKVTRLLSILQTKGSLAFQHFRYSLKERYPLLVKKLDDTAMRETPIVSSAEGRRRIFKRWDSLVLNLKADEVMSYLQSENILTDADCKRIKASVTKEDQARVLLDMIPEKGDRAYQHFTIAVKAQQPKLGDLLEKEEGS
ncbi:uncharacterized protein [Amphiura filiformis]